MPGRDHLDELPELEDRCRRIVTKTSLRKRFQKHEMVAVDAQKVEARGTHCISPSEDFSTFPVCRQTVATLKIFGEIFLEAVHQD